MENSAIFLVTFVVTSKKNTRITHSVKKKDISHCLCSFRDTSRGTVTKCTFCLRSTHAHQVHRPIAQRSIGLWHAMPLPIIHHEAQHFSNLVKFEQNYKMPWNICFFRTNFAVVKINKQTNKTQYSCKTIIRSPMKVGLESLWSWRIHKTWVRAKKLVNKQVDLGHLSIDCSIPQESTLLFGR